MHLDFKLSVYFGFVIVSSVQTSLALSQSDTEESLKDNNQVSRTEERLEDAFEEQGYYLQRLFLEYGSNGTLTYEGLQKLLGSLGLGEVSVLEIRHGTVMHSSLSLAHIHQHLKEDHHHHHHPHQPSSSQDSETETIKEKEEIPAIDVKVVVHGSSGQGDGSQTTSSLGTEKTILLSDHPTKNHLHENCLNVTQLLWNFGLDQTSHITPDHFTFLCPALLYQIDSGVCLRHTNPHTHEDGDSVAFLRALGWASVALLVISLPSFLALGLTPLVPPAALRSFLCPMAAMAVGTLCGDALLHLLPHANSGPHSDHQNAVLKGLSVLGGLYLLFTFESILGLRHSYKKSKKRKQNVTEAREMEALEGSSTLDCSMNPESGHGHSHTAPDRSSSSLSTVAWMVIMGDGIHNLTDGLAIGVAFSQSLTGGLSTAIAVFCHELPHELGDLAMLLAAGWPVRRLALFSLLSALLGYVGVLTGSALGHHWAQHSPWILTLTAGVFLYVALTDMMPEMLHGDQGSASPLISFLLQSVGLLTGGGIMLCIALFEENISVNLSDG
ncbi:zinc transporter ZIP5 [Tachysurus fulvidraco]|uniref:zinc transporter ZIP5 n=1 Tax=Tachysurus fulvidraco TaxID=1234273 RepID=UPI001FED67B2|nr:zinc transporter ZIP5 [Tachysurus fulvidraco]XP_047662965.1 zinc transporter ZIP5 [Tachysurus fulvidraco]